MAKNRIAMLRKEQGMNQKELGEKLGVGQTTVSAWETGKNEPDQSSLEKMAGLFHSSVGYLLGIEDGPFRGLTREQQQSYWEQMEREHEKRQIEKEAEKEEREKRSGLSDEEIEELCQQKEQQEFEENTMPADTVEGYLASQAIDRQPKAMRQWLLKMVRELISGPKE